MDWILPIALSAFVFDEIIRTQLRHELFLINKEFQHVAVGFDNGDFIELTPISKNGE